MTNDHIQLDVLYTIWPVINSIYAQRLGACLGALRQTVSCRDAANGNKGLTLEQPFGMHRTRTLPLLTVVLDIFEAVQELMRYDKNVLIHQDSLDSHVKGKYLRKYNNSFLFSNVLVLTLVAKESGFVLK